MENLSYELNHKSMKDLGYELVKVFACFAIVNLITLGFHDIYFSGKRTDIFDFLRNTDCDIYCLQETYFTDTEERSILDLWNGECLLKQL